MRKYIPFTFRAMRSILFAFFILVISSFSPFFYPKGTITARAAEEYYACALTNHVFFYASANEDSGLFWLPYTYYVKILSRGSDFCYVQYLTDTPPYKAVYGYCKTSELTFVDYVPARPYLYYTIEAIYLLSDLNNTVIGDSVLSSVTLTYVYYGDFAVGSATYCYVSSDGKMGYLPKTMSVSYELNNDYTPPATSDSEESSEDDTETNGGKIALIVIIGLLILAALLFFFLPRKNFKQDDYEDFTH